MKQRSPSGAVVALAAVFAACTLWFERYTLPARRAVANALSIAHERGHDAIQTEDLLLGLQAADPALLEGVRSRVGFAPNALRSAIDRQSPPRPRQDETPQDLPLSADLNTVLERATSATRDRITTKVLLLGLVNGPGLGGRVLREVGVTEGIVLAVAETNPDA
jgi:ATP-dependent Clp protease ATP-binding subunit ClpB